MIIVDTSAIVAIIKREDTADTLLACLANGVQRHISAASYVEAATVLAHRHRGGPSAAVTELDRVLEALGIEVVSIDVQQAREAVAGRLAFGQGFGVRGGLNYGDSFAYTLAKVRDAPLLFVGNDFSRTDIVSALA